LPAPDLERVAALARLQLDPEEERRLTEDLFRIIELVGDLPELHAAPSTGWTAPCLPLRADEPGTCLAREAFLAMAPEAVEGGVRVPKVGEL
jgi:aspartyl-tRNA(Asn)/glutamyl-tRNA(Gln) amidotransferase subunit C